MTNTFKIVYKTVHFTLLAITVVYLLSGYGITHATLVGKLTLGLLSKPLAFKMHLLLDIPFMALLALHIALTIFAGVTRKKKKGVTSSPVATESNNS